MTTPSREHVADAVRDHLARLGVAGADMPATTLGVDGFSGGDLIEYEIKGIRHAIPCGAGAAAAAETMAMHIRHGDAIALSTERAERRVRKRFEALGCRVEPAQFVSADLDPQGGLVRIEIVCAVEILGDDYLPTTALVQVSEPKGPPKGIDGWRIHARTHRRRQAALAGRGRVDALVVCPVALRAADADADARRDLLDGMTAILEGRAARPDRTRIDTPSGVSAVEASEGRIVATVSFGTASWRNRTLLVRDANLPEALAAAAIGRPVTAIAGRPELEGLVTMSVRNRKSPRRLTVVVEPFDGVPMREAMERCRREDRP